MDGYINYILFGFTIFGYIIGAAGIYYKIYNHLDKHSDKIETLTLKHDDIVLKVNNIENEFRLEIKELNKNIQTLSTTIYGLNITMENLKQIIENLKNDKNK